MSERPECYGDIDYYDPDDEACTENCAYFQSCGIRVARSNNQSKKRELKAQTRIPNKQSNRVAKKQEPTIIIEPEENDSYFSVLTYNSAIEAVQAMADELSNSIRYIPRKGYGNIFNRKKK
jgi:uncharacterized membrane protein YqiK